MYGLDILNYFFVSFQNGVGQYPTPPLPLSPDPKNNSIWSVSYPSSPPQPLPFSKLSISPNWAKKCRIVHKFVTN